MPSLSLQCGPAYAVDILVVDDQPLNLKIIFSMLVKLGCDPNRIVTATDGQQAVEHFQKFPCDLIFMDCHMPWMDGFESTRLIRMLERKNGKKSVPIIAFTSDGSLTVQNIAQAVGMNDFLHKPCGLNKLRDIIEIYVF